MAYKDKLGNIKFRGKKKCTDYYQDRIWQAGEWLYGYYYRYLDIDRIMLPREGQGQISFDIMPETLGRFTGAKDVNGKDIYEGDIVRCNDWFNSEVFYNDELCAFVVDNQEKQMLNLLHDFNNVVVIGNKFDNPELLPPDEED